MCVHRHPNIYKRDGRAAHRFNMSMTQTLTTSKLARLVFLTVNEIRLAWTTNAAIHRNAHYKQNECPRATAAALLITEQPKIKKKKQSRLIMLKVNPT